MRWSVIALAAAAAAGARAAEAQSEAAMPRPAESARLSTQASSSLEPAADTPEIAADTPEPAAARPLPARTPDAWPAQAPGAPAGVETPSPPLMPSVDDPMLRSPEPPSHVLQSWPQALELARGHSTSLARAAAQVRVARAQAERALSALRPSLSGDARVNRSLLFTTGTNLTGQGIQTNVRIPNPATIWNGSVTLQQNLLNLRSFYDADTAKLATRAAQANGDEVERQTLGALADTLVSVATAERLAQISRVSLSSNLSTLDLTRRRARLGAANAIDVLRIEQQVADNRTTVVQSDETLRRSYEALGMALGFSEAWGVSPQIDISGLDKAARTVCRQLSESAARSDVRAAELDRAVAERARDSARLGYSPTIGLQSNVSYSTQPQLARPVQWQVGALLSIPFYDGGRLSAERAVGAANALVARQRLTDAQRQAHLEATQAKRGVSVAQRNLELSQQARDIAVQSARLSHVAFMAGSGTSFDLVDSSRRQLLAEIDVTLKEMELVRSRVVALLALSNCSL